MNRNNIIGTIVFVVLIVTCSILNTPDNNRLSSRLALIETKDYKIKVTSIYQNAFMNDVVNEKYLIPNCFINNEHKDLKVGDSVFINLENKIFKIIRGRNIFDCTYSYEYKRI